MAFTSPAFGVFLALVLFAYWFVDRRRQTQNVVLLLASYAFYAYWNWRYLAFLVGLSLISYLAGLWLSRLTHPVSSKRLLVGSLVLLAGNLLVLKYTGFVSQAVSDVLRLLGQQASFPTLQLMAVVGISYYTFIVVGYVVDVYRGTVTAERNWVTYFAYVSFFPQLLSGPISRTPVLAQFSRERRVSWSQIQSGAGQFIWGMFKKLAVADTLGKEVNYIFHHHESLPGSVLWVGMLLYSFQVYADFSGYSDMARGVGLLFGIELPQNFKNPFLSRNIGEFWRRWHTSLSDWLMQYIYIPLGGRAPVKWLHIRNLLITFTLSGLWHGPHWTYVFWGLLNGLYFIPYLLIDRLKRVPGVVAADRRWPTFSELGGMALTLFLVSLSRVFFRSPTMGDAWDYLGRMFSWSAFSVPDFGYKSLVWIAVLMGAEWTQRRREHVLDFREDGVAWQLAACAVVALMIWVFADTANPSEYLYFKY